VIVLTGKSGVSTGNIDDFIEKIVVSCNEMRNSMKEMKADLLKLTLDFENFRNNYIGDDENAKK